MEDAFMDLADPDDDSFDQQQLKLATERSLHTANTELQPRTKPRGTGMAEDDELQWALRESMRMFEEEQGRATAGRKRSSSEDDAEHGHQQQQQGPSAQQGPAQQPTGSGPLKRQRSLGAAAGTEVGAGLASTRPLHHTPAQNLGGARLTRLHGNVVTTALPHQPQQQGAGPLLGVQRSASVTNAAVGLRPWPSRGTGFQPHAQQHQGPGLQQQHLGLGRSASAHDLQAAGLLADADMSDELEGSRPSSPAGAGAARINQQGEVDDGDEEDLLDIQDSDSSMTSIAHDSGLLHTRSTWGADLLHAAAAAQQAVPRLVGPAPSRHDPSEWQIHSRQYYVGQAIFWQPGRNQPSYPGRVLSVDGGGSPTHPVLYTAEVHGHHALSYVEATCEQLQPQLRKGEFVWCKPAAVKAACWSEHGPLFAELHPPGRRHLPDWEPVEQCSTSPWMRGLVLRTQLWNHRNPIAELRICGTGGKDCCWFRHGQIELMREIGESSATAEARAAACARAAQQQQHDAAAAAAAAALCGAQSLGQENEMDMAALELFLQQDQQQQQQHQHQQQGGVLQEHADVDAAAKLLELAAAGDQDSLEALTMLAMQQQMPPEAILQQTDATGQVMLEGQVEAAAAQAVAAAAQAATPAPVVPSVGQPVEASTAAAADPGPGVPSGMSHPVAALTGESGLEAAAAASVVDQAAGADTAPAAGHQPQQQHPQHAPAAAAKPPLASQPGSKLAVQQQQQQQQDPAQQQAAAGGAVVEGTGESAEGLGVQEVVADSCPLLGDDGPGGGEGDGPDASPKEPLSNQHSGVEDDVGTRPKQEGFGET